MALCCDRRVHAYTTGFVHTCTCVDCSTFKVILVGPSGAGKTCLMARFTEGVFNEGSAVRLLQSSVGQCAEIHFNSPRLVLRLW